MVEVALKKFLRAEGYTFKGEITEGFTVWLQVMRTKNRAGSELGMVGSVLIGSVQWQTYADQAISADCKDNHQFVEKIGSLVGTKMIVVDSTIAAASDAEALGDSLAPS